MGDRGEEEVEGLGRESSLLSQHVLSPWEMNGKSPLLKCSIAIISLGNPLRLILLLAISPRGSGASERRSDLSKVSQQMAEVAVEPGKDSSGAWALNHRISYIASVYFVSRSWATSPI